MTDEDYVEAAMLEVLRAVTSIESDGSGTGGYVRPAVFGALCGAIAALAVEANPNMTMRDKKYIADQCRKGILDEMKYLEEMKAKGAELPWEGKVMRPN